MKMLLLQSNRAKRVSKTIPGPAGGTPAARWPSFSRRALASGAIAPLLLLGLVSCGHKTATRVTDAEISQTVVYRGVLMPSIGLLTPPQLGTISLSVVEVWDARSPIPDPAGLEAVATIDSVAVQLVVDDRRSTYPGRLDRSTGILTTSGAPGLNATMIDGRFEGPKFIAIPPSTHTILAYGGSWSGTGPSGLDRGFLSFLIDGTTVTGFARHEDGTSDRVGGSYASDGGIVITFPGYTLTGITSRYAIFGDYVAAVEGHWSGTWTTGPRPF